MNDNLNQNQLEPKTNQNGISESNQWTNQQCAGTLNDQLGAGHANNICPNCSGMANDTNNPWNKYSTEQSTCKINEFGTKVWRNVNGQVHRTDGPAIEFPQGLKAWYLNDKFHRTDGPAIEWPDGGREWYLNGKLHRTDGPAIEEADGTKVWFLNGQCEKPIAIVEDPSWFSIVIPIIIFGWIIFFIYHILS